MRSTTNVEARSMMRSIGDFMIYSLMGWARFPRSWTSLTKDNSIYSYWSCVDTKTQFAKKFIPSHSPYLASKPSRASFKHRRRMTMVPIHPNKPQTPSQLTPYPTPKKSPWPEPRLYSAPNAPTRQVSNPNPCINRKFGI